MARLPSQAIVATRDKTTTSTASIVLFFFFFLPMSVANIRAKELRLRQQASIILPAFLLP